MQIAIDNEIFRQAQTEANRKGENLVTLIERFLLRFIGSGKAAEEQPVPDVVQSLIGAGESIDLEDLNAREAYNQHLIEKHKWPNYFWTPILLLMCWNIVSRTTRFSGLHKPRQRFYKNPRLERSDYLGA